LEIVENGFLANLEVKPSLHDQVETAQLKSVGIQKIKENIKSGQAKYKCFTEDIDGIVWFGRRLVVPKKQSLRELILKEPHESSYSIHLGATKMYQDL
jgi:hypothetical protein